MAALLLVAVLSSGTPHALRNYSGHGNGAAMQSMENDEAVSHPSHSRLGDADGARVSHIPTTTATSLNKGGQAAATAYTEALVCLVSLECRAEHKTELQTRQEPI